MKVWYIVPYLHIQGDPFNHIALNQAEIKALYELIKKIVEE